MLRLSQLDEEVYANGQLDADDFAKLAASGVKTIVNNRPDGEDIDQLSAAEAERLAGENGMAYYFIPVGREGVTPQAAEAFAAVLADAPKPIVAYCRSGMRSSTIHAHARARARG